MMENKYYTPKIEEFHVGFEFEYQEIEHAQWIEDVFILNWEKEESNIEDFLEWESIRVKYLSREDIESLGFEATKDEDIFIKDDVTLVYEYDSKELSVYIDTVYNEIDLVNNIRVKNKSEFKDILEKLNII